MRPVATGRPLRSPGADARAITTSLRGESLYTCRPDASFEVAQARTPYALNRHPGGDPACKGCTIARAGKLILPFEAVAQHERTRAWVLGPDPAVAGGPGDVLQLALAGSRPVARCSGERDRSSAPREQ